MLVRVTYDLTQVAGQVLAGEGNGAAGQLRGSCLALRGKSGRGDIPAEAGGRGSRGGGGGCRGRQGGGAGCSTEGFQWINGRRRGSGRLVQEVVVRWRVVQGSGSAVLH